MPPAPSIDVGMHSRNTMKGLLLDIWRDEDGNTTLIFSGELGEEAKYLLEPNSEIIHSFYAVSHFDAMSQYYEFMNWGEYISDYDMDYEPYDVKKLEERSKVRAVVDQILWEDWDPIGINDVAPRDEYQRYVPQIMNMALSNSSVKEIADRLHYIETKTIGVDGDIKRCMAVAEKIKKRIPTTE